MFKEVQDGADAVEKIGKTSRGIFRLFQSFRKSAANKPYILAAPKRWDISFGVPVPVLTIVCTITHYESVDVVPCSAYAEFRLGNVLITGLTSVTSEVIRPKKHIDIAFRHNLASSEIIAIARHARSHQTDANMRLQLPCYRVGHLGGQRHFKYTMPWTTVAGAISGTVSGWPMSPADAALMRRLLRSYDKHWGPRPRD